MKSMRMAGLAGGLALSWAVTTGCVSKDEYLRVKFAGDRALERVVALERDLSDERARSGSLQKELDTMRGELSTQTSLAASLRVERDRLDEMLKRLQGNLDDLEKQGLGDVQVVEVKLPPELDRALKEFAAQYPDTIEYDERLGAVRWKSDLTFELGSDVVNPGAKGALRSFAQIVQSAAADPFEIIIVGHTDNVPIRAAAQKHPSNWHLSAHRAIAVMSVLHEDGVPSERMGCMGYGEFQPLEPNPASGGNEANRRVEIFLVGKGEAMGGYTASGQSSSASVAQGETH